MISRRSILSGAILSFPIPIIACSELSPEQHIKISDDVNKAFQVAQELSVLIGLIPGGAQFVPILQALETVAQKAYNTYYSNISLISTVQSAFTVADAAVKMYSSLPQATQNINLTRELLEADATAQKAINFMVAVNTSASIEEANKEVNNLINIITSRAVFSIKGIRASIRHKTSHLKEPEIFRD